ncbi:glycosyltransferase [Proteiniphilum sp. UBA1028]|uniref:glycosyltransferase n=1 Tax=Proteiniphilum sp. UBA1028 TaxID=1947251 RepID=UPI0025DDFC84|nr:glycosyltransferase [Proteiniphilum sp. UBA1028]
MFFFSTLSLFEWTLGGTLLLCFLVQLFFYLFLYRKPYAYERKRNETPLPEEDLPGISVIITSKNNSEELKRNLPFILEQDYPHFEVIVVNSGSTDETDMVLKAAEIKYPRLYHTFVPAEADSINEKKLALTLGIKAAKYDLLLFTESFCKPCTTQWIKTYGTEFAKGRDIVLGFNRIGISKNVSSRKFILYDNLIHHLKFLSMAILHKPFMGIGRNMAYRKELFFAHKGYSSILHIDGGDDDLYINQIARKKNTGVVLSPDSLTETSGVNNFFIWRALKSKHLYTKQFYKGFSAHLFGWESFSKYLFYATLTGCVIYGIVAPNHLLLAWALLLFLVRYWIQLMVINRNSRLFDGITYHIHLIPFDLFQPFNNMRFRRYANRRNRRR